MTDLKFTEASIAAAINRQLWGNSTLMVPNCGWTGHECDLLVIEKGLRIIDVEIKISRADLKADYAKDKWWAIRPWSRRHEPKAPRIWPNKVWKHYYVLPAMIWDKKLLEALPPASGVITLRHQPNGILAAGLERYAKPNRDAKPISPADAIDIARLASLRMWASLAKEK